MSASALEVSAPKVSSIIAGNDKRPILEKSLKGGKVRFTYISKKDYGAKFGVKGAELRRLHEQYRREQGLANNVVATAKLTARERIVEKEVIAADGKSGCMYWVAPDKLGISAIADPVKTAETLTTEQLLAIVEGRKTTAKTVEVPATVTPV